MLLLILIILAVFIFYKLYNEFGKTKNVVINISEEEMGKILESVQCLVPPKQKQISEKQQANNKMLNDIKKLQEKFPTFTSTTFLEKAEEMFGAIFNAFVNSNKNFLQSNLSNTLYKSFIEQIQKRESLNLKQEISIKHKKTIIEKIQILTSKAKLSISFNVSQVSAMITSEGISFDNPKRLARDVLHKWVFERKFTENDWKLAKTSSIEL
ncbi:MAG: Tim44/TimA family putative adaptor protein [Holosporales bacterium]|jgi:predicted lipid-binding transport protein (Tim44 family)|nr:Tim44/TimA family putative adaptor protein [Holosporales bacterium]